MPLPPPSVLIVSQSDDLHALAVRKALIEDLGARCWLFESDMVSDRGRYAWTEYGDDSRRGSQLVASDGDVVDLEAVDAIWYRRGLIPQVLDETVQAPAHLDVINHSAHAALMGALMTSFRGQWVSEPGLTTRAENKLVQLRAAHAAGLRTPRTLVSNDPQRIREFCSEFDFRVVIKSLWQSRLHGLLLTQQVRPEHLESDESLKACPTIYQELIPGVRHLRVSVFGDDVFAMLLEAEDLDWRTMGRIDCSIYELEDGVKARLTTMLQALGLRMGIFDFKLSGASPVFLELNPQGQFLFAEGLTGLPLIQGCAKFLFGEAKESQVKEMPAQAAAR